MCTRGPAAWSVITRWLYNVTQSAYQHFRCQLPRAVPLALHPHLPHVRPLKDRRDPNAYTNQPTLCVPPIGQASRPMRKRAALGSANRGSVHAPARVAAVALGG